MAGYGKHLDGASCRYGRTDLLRAEIAYLRPARRVWRLRQNAVFGRRQRDRRAAEHRFVRRRRRNDGRLCVFARPHSARTAGGGGTSAFVRRGEDGRTQICRCSYACRAVSVFYRVRRLRRDHGANGAQQRRKTSAAHPPPDESAGGSPRDGIQHPYL